MPTSRRKPTTHDANFPSKVHQQQRCKAHPQNIFPGLNLLQNRFSKSFKHDFFEKHADRVKRSFFVNFIGRTGRKFKTWEANLIFFML
jgi:hypothetical protein